MHALEVACTYCSCKQKAGAKPRKRFGSIGSAANQGNQLNRAHRPCASYRSCGWLVASLAPSTRPLDHLRISGRCKDQNNLLPTKKNQNNRCGYPAFENGGALFFLFFLKTFLGFTFLVHDKMLNVIGIHVSIITIN